MAERLSNPDLEPVPGYLRDWSMWNIAALWVGMAVCVPTYMLASGMISQGMTWWQATLTVLLGNVIVLVPMILNGHAGTKYGVPFPVLLSASFGTVGAHIPTIARALVACGWFGIQCWIGGAAIYQILVAMHILEAVPLGNAAPVSQFLCFFAFWGVNLTLILIGINSIKWLELLAAPFLILCGLALLGWAIVRVTGEANIGQLLTPVINDPANALPRLSTRAEFMRVFLPQLTAMVGFWATLSLNIPDFTRYAQSQRDQVIGQLVGLPLTMTLFCFIGIVVTNATVVLYGTAIWDPVVLVGKLGSSVPVVILSMLALTLATLSTNLAANVVSPANGFSNLSPSRISFRTGGIITCALGVIIMPWYLMRNLEGYIFTWLIGYSALLGPIAGIMLCDYFVLRRTRLDEEALYDPEGPYGGVNWRAMIALVLGVLPNLPGFLHAATNRSHATWAKVLDAARISEISTEQIQLAQKAGNLPSGSPPVFPAVFDEIYLYAWFVGLPLAALVYAVLMFRRAKPAEPSGPDGPAGAGVE